VLAYLKSAKLDYYNFGEFLLSKVDVDGIARAGVEGNFDLYRDNYHLLSFEDLKRINQVWVAKYPDQHFYDSSFVIEAFRKIVSNLGRDDIQVVELGGFDGSLAFQVLQHFPDATWLNLEIGEHMPAPGLDGFQYKEQVLTDHLWECKPNIDGRDVFVSGDTLEHFPDDQFQKVIDYVTENRVSYLVLKIPISDKGQDWRGCFGSHLLRMGRNQVKKVLVKRYVLVMEKRRYGLVRLAQKLLHGDVTADWCSMWMIK
jgi:hypothetical protein